MSDIEFYKLHGTWKSSDPSGQCLAPSFEIMYIYSMGELLFKQHTDIFGDIVEPLVFTDGEWYQMTSDEHDFSFRLKLVSDELVLSQIMFHEQEQWLDSVIFSREGIFYISTFDAILKH